MVKTMTRHVLDKHPDVAKKMEQMHNADPKKWGKEMKPKWDAAPGPDPALPRSSLTAHPSIAERLRRPLPENAYFRIPRSALVSASMNAGRGGNRSAYFISGAAGFRSWMP
jgi:hypothetical protein